MSERPVLHTVDDDPSVSRAVARDLRRRYGDTSRVVRAESGPDALEVHIVGGANTTGAGGTTSSVRLPRTRPASG